MSPAFITLPDMAPKRLCVSGMGMSLATATPMPFSWHLPAKGSSRQQPAWLCRCLQPARRPLSRPTPSWCGWPGWMWACARVARWAGCAPSLCWRGLRACLDRPAPWRLTAGGRHELLPWPGSVNPSHGRWQAFGAVLRVGAPMRAQHGLIHGPGVVWRVQLTPCAVN